jgi:hypothetical protein
MILGEEPLPRNALSKAVEILKQATKPASKK